MTATSVLICGFAGCVLTAAWSDFRTLRLPNILSAAIFILFAPYAALALTPEQAFSSIVVASMMLAVGFFGYAKGLLGGGDAKLLAACMAWAGTGHAFEFLAVAAIAGGVLALALNSPLTAAAGPLIRRNWPANEGARSTMPYGVAIAAGALAVVVELLSR